MATAAVEGGAGAGGTGAASTTHGNKRQRADHGVDSGLIASTNLFPEGEL